MPAQRNYWQRLIRCHQAALQNIPILTFAGLASRMLFSHPNVWNTCLIMLRQRGYRLFLLSSLDEFTSLAECTWNAEKDGMTLRADNPIELLGLASIYEHHHPVADQSYWWRIDGPSIIGELELEWRRKLENG